MLSCRLYDIGNIISLLENLSCIQITKGIKYLNSEKIGHRRINWVKFIQKYIFDIKHQADLENRAADALSRLVAILHALDVRVAGFERDKVNTRCIETSVMSMQHYSTVDKASNLLFTMGIFLWGLACIHL